MVTPSLDQGAVYVFNRNPTTETWTQSQKLYAQAPSAFERFGATVAMDEYFLVVGVPQRDASTAVTMTVSSLCVAVCGCVRAPEPTGHGCQ